MLGAEQAARGDPLGVQWALGLWFQKTQFMVGRLLGKNIMAEEYDGAQFMVTRKQSRKSAQAKKWPQARYRP